MIAYTRRPWPCGHDRTSDNTAKVGKAGVRCRECRNALKRRIYREHATKPEASA